jgi:hypothetical protein
MIALITESYLQIAWSPFCQSPGGYGDLWAGCDCTYALATLSLDKEDANRCPGGIHLEPFLNHPICGLLLGIP